MGPLRLPVLPYEGSLWSSLVRICKMFNLDHQGQLRLLSREGWAGLRRIPVPGSKAGEAWAIPTIHVPTWVASWPIQQMAKEHRAMVRTLKAELGPAVFAKQYELRIEGVSSTLASAAARERAKTTDKTRRALLEDQSILDGGRCPMCRRTPVVASGSVVPGAEFDHGHGVRWRSTEDDLWIICGPCHTEKTAEENAGRRPFSPAFDSFQWARRRLREQVKLL